MSAVSSNSQIFNETAKTDTTMLKNNSRFFQLNNSIQYGIDGIDDLRQGQIKRQNMIKDSFQSNQFQKSQGNQNDDDDEIEDEEAHNDITNNNFQIKVDQLSYFTNIDEQYPNMSKITSQVDSQKHQSGLSPSSYQQNQNQKKAEKNFQVSPQKENQKSFPTSSSSSSSSSEDSNGSPGGGDKNDQQHKKKNQRINQREYSMSSPHRGKDNDSMNIRKKRDKDSGSRHFEHETSGVYNKHDMKKKKTSIFGMDDQSQYNQSNIHGKQSYKRRMSSKRQMNPKQIWSCKVFSIIMYINKLIFTLKKALIFTKPHLLTTLQLNLINDKSSRDIGEGWGTSELKLHKLIKKGFNKYEFMGGFAKNYKNFRKTFKRKFKRLIQFYGDIQNVIRKFNKLIPVFDPLSKWIFIWELMIFLVTSFNFIFIPFDYSFSVITPEMQFLYFHKISPVIFFTDIIIRFNTCYFHRGYLVQERKKIIKNYLINQCVIDIITALSLFTTFFGFEGTYLLFFLRIFYFSKILDKLTESIMLNTKLSGIVSLLLLLAEIQFLCHIFTCAWHSLGQYEISQSRQSWLLTKQNLSSPMSLYVNSYYFCTITMTTIGFGDITPQTDNEKIFVSFMSILASGVFGYSLNFIGSILMDMKKQREIFQQRLAEVNQYMTKHQVQSHLQSKTRKYLEYIHSEGVDKQQQPEKSLDYLSKFLKEEILKDVYLKSIKNIPLFENKFGQAFKERLALRMREQIYGPDEIIVKTGNYEIPRVYIIMKGEVELYWEVGSNKTIQTKENEKKLKFLKEGSSFGFIEFFTANYQSFVSAKSLGVSQIQYIQLDDFLDLLQDFENEKEIFCYIRDSVTMKKEYTMIQVPCFSCSRFEHLIHECPLLFYDSQKEKIIKTYNKNFIEERKKFSRDLRRCRYQTLLECKQQTQDVCSFREREIYKTETEYSNDSDDDQFEDQSYDEEISDDQNDEEEQRKVNETKENDSDEESKKSKRKRLRSQSVKQQTQIIQAVQNHRGSLLGEDLLNKAGQQRRSILLQAFDDKMPSTQSINRLPSLNSRAARLSIREQAPIKVKETTQYDQYGTVNETELNTDMKKTQKLEFNQIITQEQFLLHNQQYQQKQNPEIFIEDRICSYDIYFPHNNIKNIIDEIERMKRKLRTKQIQKQRRTGLNNRLITLKQLHTLKTMFADKFDQDSCQKISTHQNMD